MKKIVSFHISIFTVVISYAQFSCVQLLNTDMNLSVRANETASVCFTPISGMFVVAFPPFVPAIDTAYVTQQDPKGNAYFITDSCIGFDAFNNIGNASIEYTIRTTNSCTKNGRVNITITCPFPVASDDFFEVYSDSSYQALPVGVNDTIRNPNNVSTPAVYRIIQPPVLGTVTISNDTIYYTGDNVTEGEEMIVYEVENGCGSKDTAGVLLLLSVREAPVAERDTVFFNRNSGVCSELNVLKNDQSIYSDAQLRIASFDSVSANNGTISQIGDSTLCYYFDADKIETDSFTYTVCDVRNHCVTETVFVIIPAVAYNNTDTVIQATESILSVTNNDFIVGSPFLELCSTPLHGTAVISGTTIIYTSNKNYPSPLSERNFDDGLDSFCYKICVAIDGIDYCDSAVQYISVKPQKKLFIPEGFSPNGDGINDALELITNGSYPESYLIIYNRLGDEVWRSGKSYGNNFKGENSKGVPLPDGTYYYIFKFNDGVNKDISSYVIINR